MSKLITVQIALSLQAIGALKSTPQTTSDVLLNFQPLDTLAQFQAARSALSLWEAGGWRSTRFGHTQILEIPIGRNILSTGNGNSDYMSTFFEFNNIDVTIPDSNA